VVGTSAGSVVGAQITSGADLEALYAEQLRDATGESAAKLGVWFLAQFVYLVARPGDARTRRRRIGAAALKAGTVPESERVEVIRSRLTSTQWPGRRLLVTAVDAYTGEFRAFDASSGVELVDAVAASCAVPLVWPPVSVDGSRYVDGGMRSAANADLAAGAGRVVVLAPITRAFSKATRIDTQLAGLGPGVRSLVVAPDAGAVKAIGKNMLDPAARAASARAGRDQAASVADEVAAVWR